MAMTAGTVTVDDDGVVTGGDLARALYDAEVATLDLPMPPTPGSTDSPWSAQRPVTQAEHDGYADAIVRAKQGIANRATAWAGAFVTYMQANAQAKIAADATGDDLMKDSTTANCKHPSSNKFLPIV